MTSYSHDGNGWVAFPDDSDSHCGSSGGAIVVIHSNDVVPLVNGDELSFEFTLQSGLSVAVFVVNAMGELRPVFSVPAQATSRHWRSPTHKIHPP